MPLYQSRAKRAWTLKSREVFQLRGSEAVSWIPWVPQRCLRGSGRLEEHLRGRWGWALHSTSLASTRAQSDNHNGLDPVQQIKSRLSEWCAGPRAWVGMQRFKLLTSCGTWANYLVLPLLHLSNEDINRFCDLRSLRRLNCLMEIKSCDIVIYNEYVIYKFGLLSWFLN